MKEVKSFFTSDNRLNKGYADTRSARHISAQDNAKLSAILPSSDTLAIYEEMHPGAFEKLVSMLSAEQKHRHLINEVHVQMSAKARFMGRVFGLLVICIVGYVTLELSKIGMATEGLIFAGIAFASIFGVSILSNKCGTKVKMRSCDTTTSRAIVEEAPIHPRNNHDEPAKKYRKHNRRHRRG